MRYEELAPHPRLRPFVRTYWTLAGRGIDIPPQPVLPDGCTELIVHRAGPFRRLDADGASYVQTTRMFAGQLQAPIVLSPDGDADLISVRFEPFGAHAMLGVDQSALADQVIEADQLGAPWLSRAMRDAESSETTAVALHIIERALLTRLDARRPSTDLRVIGAAGALMRRSGSMRVDEAAALACVTPRHLERLFQRHIGTTPKHFARVLRFQAAANRVLAAEAPTLVDVSEESGYFDQSHMVKDFVTFAGTTPGQFAAKLGELTRVMLS